MMLSRTLLVLGFTATSLAWGEPLDSPERIALLGYVEGRVAFHVAQESTPSALPDRPLIPGDRLITEAGGRAELALGTATVRLDEGSELSIVTLEATNVRVELNHGTASVHLRELFDDETFEVATPNTTLALRETGEYRIAVPTDGITDLTVRGGAAEAMTAGGPVRIADGQRVRLEGQQALASLATPRSADAFDDWVLERELQLADLEPSPELMASGDQYEELNRYGEWYEESSYGRVWMPSFAYGGYDPFRYGHWQHYGTSWLWVNSMPWGYYTSNYGRWAYLDHLNRWCWVPARRDHREHVAQDTRPFGRPSNDARPRDERRPVATSAGLPRRIDSDRQPIYRRSVESAKQSQSETFVPSTNRDQNPPQRTAPVRQSGETTMQPARPAESRSTPTATRPTSTLKPAFGTPQMP